MIPTKFYLKTALHGITPGGFGYSRILRRQRDPSYNHERDMHPIRRRHNGASGWKNEDSHVSKRAYKNYEEYQTHQRQKFEEILKMKGGFSNRTVVAWRRRFYNRFKHVAPLLSADATILCLGARQGTEVEVWRDLGFSNAYGIDLNPGPGNPFVVAGDFMKLTEANQSIDLVYTNSLDHALDVDAFLAENVRVLKPEGFALYDLPRYSGTRSPGAFEAIGWEKEEDILSALRASFRRVVHSAVEGKWQWMLLQGPHSH